MLVKTLFPHSNSFGASFAKAVGDEYEVADDGAPLLIDAGLVELVEPVADPAPAPASRKKKTDAETGTDLVADPALDADTVSDASAGQG